MSAEALYATSDKRQERLSSFGARLQTLRIAEMNLRGSNHSRVLSRTCAPLADPATGIAWAIPVLDSAAIGRGLGGGRASITSRRGVNTDVLGGTAAIALVCMARIADQIVGEVADAADGGTFNANSFSDGSRSAHIRLFRTVSPLG
jgi:hypothetical protein